MINHLTSPLQKGVEEETYVNLDITEKKRPRVQPRYHDTEGLVLPAKKKYVDVDVAVKKDFRNYVQPHYHDTKGCQQGSQQRNRHVDLHVYIAGTKIFL